MTQIVSIITCTYNRAHLLGETIQSVLSQTFSDFEYIIIDDGSTDNTQELIHSFNDKRINYVRHDHSNGYLSIARNHGLKKASGKYIAFIDSDDLWKDNYLILLVQTLEQNPGFDFCFTDAEVFSTERIIQKSLYQKSGVFKGSVFNDYLHNGFVIYTSCLFLRKSCLTSTGYQDETLPDGDFDFILCLTSRFKAIAFYKPLVRIRKHNTNYTSNASLKRLDGYISPIKKILQQKIITPSEFKKIYGNLNYQFGIQLKKQNKIIWAARYFLISIWQRPLHIKSWVKLFLLLPEKIVSSISAK